MPRPLELYTNLFTLITTLLLAYAAAAAQATPTALPSDCSAAASIPLPPEAEKIPAPKTPPSCASYRFYRGIGRPLNYREARVCAWEERLAKRADLSQNLEEPTAWVVGGPLILADIYANGVGVQRNVPLAMRFGCEFEEATAMAALPALRNLNGPPPHRCFELCDYAATTFTGNFCAGYEAEIEDNRRIRYYDILKSEMPPAQKAAFEKLIAAEDAYVNAHISEVDQGGSIHTVRTLTSQTILKNLFRNELIQFERKHWPTLSAGVIKTADLLMRREYDSKLHQLQDRPKDQTYDGAVTAPGLTRAQQAWEHYRQAWLAFARLRYPAAADAIAAQITLDRYRLLKTI